MTTKEKIFEFIKKRIAETYNPVGIFIFGSQAWGNVSNDSDYDILIVVPDNLHISRPYALKGHLALSDSGFSKDILVIRKRDFIRHSQDISTLYYKIKREGIKIYSDGNI